MKFLVGFRGNENNPWSGGAFPITADSAKDAALQAFEKHGDSFPGGKATIETVCVTNITVGSFSTFDVTKLGGQ